jgi:Divergent CRAL/TRIO domain
MNGDIARLPRARTWHGRTPLPKVKMARLGEVLHFGGVLQSNPQYPSNYLAFTVLVGLPFTTSLLSKILVRLIEQDTLVDTVLDTSIILAGEGHAELPERVLATRRAVRLNGCRAASHYRLSSEPSSKRGKDTSVHAQSMSRRAADISGLLFRILFGDPAIAFITHVMSLVPAADAQRQPARVKSPKGPDYTTNGVDNDQPSIATDLVRDVVYRLELILQDIVVPVPRNRVENSEDESVSGASPGMTAKKELTQASILSVFSRSDIRRFAVASDLDLKTTALRIVQSAAWRQLTFPIDTRACRVELQNGQFFQQGRDKEGNPVFYFRNMLLGRWRRDEEALVSAVLHRFDQYMNSLGELSSGELATLVVLMGKPFRATTEADSKEEENGEEAEEDDDANHDADATDNTSDNHNPRITSDEKWYCHTNKAVILRLVHLLMAQYPERLRRCLVVVGKGNTAYFRTALAGNLMLSTMAISPRTKQKVKFLIRYKELCQYISVDQLCALAGGTEPVPNAAFEV